MDLAKQSVKYIDQYFLSGKFNMRIIVIILTVLSLVACVSVKTSDLADIKIPTNYNANNKKIFLQYDLYNKRHSKEVSGLFNYVDVRKDTQYDGPKTYIERRTELENLLKSYNYSLVKNKKDADRILQVKVLTDTMADYEGPGSLGGMTSTLSYVGSMMTLFVLPMVGDEKTQYSYTVYDQENNILAKFEHNLELTNVANLIFQNKEKLRIARLESYRQAIAVMIEQEAL